MVSQYQNALDSWDDILPVPRLSKKASILLVTFLSAGCYIISIDGDFVFDDSEAIVNNKDIKSVNPITEIFLNDFWGTRMFHNQSHKSYRPITVLSFRFNVWLNNGVLSSYQFRLVNILLHSVVCLLSIWVFNLLMGGNCNKAANLCAILFSVHPIHTEAVAGIVGRAELLCAVFSFVCLILYNKGVNTLRYLHNIFYTLLSIVFVLLAMFSKEQGITMLGVCFIYDVLVVNRMYLKIYFSEFYINFRILNKKKGSNIYPLANNDVQNINNGFVTNRVNQNSKSYYTENSNSIKNPRQNVIVIYLLLLRFILLLIAGLLLLFIRWEIMGGVPPTFQKVDNLSSFMDRFIFRITATIITTTYTKVKFQCLSSIDNEQTMFETRLLRNTVINYSYIYALNCWLLLCPVWLCFDWSMGCIPLIEGLNDPRIIIVILFWIIITSLCLRPLFVGCINKINRSITMALSFMIVSFLPASNLFFRVGFVIAERVLYLPSVGYCILFTIGLRQFVLNIIVLTKNSSLKSQSIYIKITSLLFWVLIIVMYSGKSVLRSYEWRTEYSLFQSALSVCPLNAKVHYNMGKVTLNKTLSLNYYKQAIRLNPEYDQAMNNLANLLKDDGNLDEAEELLRKSIKLRPNFAAAWMNLGIVLSNKKQYLDAEHAFLEAVKYRKLYPDCYYNLGILYVNQKLYREAEASWRKATSQKPNHSIAWNNLIIMLDSIGNYTEAESTALEALYILPTDAGVHFNLANTLGKLSRFDEAEKHFKIAIELNSNQALYFVNLGVLYHRWKKYQEAKEMYTRALIINPKFESAERNLKMLS